MKIQEEQEQITAEEVDSTNFEKIEKIYGKYLHAVGLDFKDGRKGLIAGFENGYIIRFRNPKNEPEYQGVQFNLSREAMYMVFQLYFAAFCDRMPDDEALLHEKLNIGRIKKLSQLNAEIAAIVKEDFDGAK